MSVDEGDEGRVVISDPRAITALAHPARSTVIELLYTGHVATATELAEVCGLTPSAMSYHLRALEKWGVVVRAEPAGDGRERPWKAAGRSLSWSSTAGTDTERTVGRALLGQYFDAVLDAVDAWNAHPESEGSVWDESLVITRGFYWLSEDEFAQLQDELGALHRRWNLDRDAAGHPPGTRRFMNFGVWVPTQDPLER